MAFSKFANAVVRKVNIKSQEWIDARGPVSDFSDRTSKVAIHNYSPEKYLLTHCTIISSVDTKEPPNAKVGKVVEGGKDINRKFANYWITSDTAKGVNANFDAWERNLLLGTYKTFIGAENYCFAENALVRMADGSKKRIKDVQIGEEVVTHKGNIRPVVHKHVRDYSGDVLDVYVNGRKKPLTTTPNHPFFTLNRQTCACGCGGDLVANVKGRTRKGTLAKKFLVGHNTRGTSETPQGPFKVRADQLEVGDILGSPRYVNAPNATHLELAEAKLLGYFLAEGCFTERDNEAIFSFSTEEDTYIQEVLDASRVIDPSALCTVSPASWGVNAYRVVVRSEIIREFLRSHIVGTYSHEKHLNQEVLYGDTECLKVMMGAYLNGDGSYHKETHRARLHSTSQVLLTQMQVILARCGLYGSVCLDREAGIEGGVIKFANGYETTPVLKNDLFVLTMDQASTQSIAPYTSKVAEYNSKKSSDLKGEGLYTLRSITGIERRSFSGKVYNLEVAEDHSYVVEEVSVANCEHIQIPELSKGKVIDAVARDLGDHVYIDILVATDRKHTDLVAKIESGEMNTLSMGCTISYSQCTKCGNVAIDEPDLCQHVKYEKGNKFVREDGEISIVAELCGHQSEPESVKFIEASWVANPAFKGAVVRNVLQGGPKIKTPTSYEHDALQTLIHDAHINAAARPDWTEAFIRTASAEITREVRKNLFGFGFDDEGGDEEEKAPEPEKGMLDEITEQLKDKAKSQLLDELKREMEPPKPKRKDMPEAERAPNDSIIQSHKRAYRQFANRYSKELGPHTQNTWKILTALSKPEAFQKHKKRFSNAEIVTAMYLYDRDANAKTFAPELYRCLSKVGGTAKYKSLRHFLQTCQKVAGRRLTKGEAKSLINRAKLLN